MGRPQEAFWLSVSLPSSGGEAGGPDRLTRWEGTGSGSSSRTLNARLVNIVHVWTGLWKGRKETGKEGGKGGEKEEEGRGRQTEDGRREEKDKGQPNQ